MIRIPQHIIDAMIAHARAELPDEACGLLTGDGEEIRKQYALTNIDHSPEHFSFDPQEQFRVLKEARSEGLKIVACYHSHPSTPARPSEEDIRLAYDSSIRYIIVSLAADEPVVKAFSIRNGTAEREEIA
jgi:proteasome lid subunit RPN8/RPN11